jgi:hypothetical protein
LVNRVVEIDSVAGPAVLDPQALNRGLGDRDRTRIEQPRPQCVGVVRIAEQIKPDVGADRARLNPAEHQREMCVLVRWELLDPADRNRLGTDERQQSALERSLVQLDRVPQAEPADHVEQGLKRDALGVEQQLIAGIEDPQVAEHLAFRGQKRGVAACAHTERLDVVGDLPLQEARRIATCQRQLPAFGAVEQPAGLGDRAVIGADGAERGHG